jgi:colicin import membrane protein
MALDKEEH